MYYLILPLQWPRKKYPVIRPVLQEENRDSERFSDLLEVTKPEVVLNMNSGSLSSEA